MNKKTSLLGLLVLNLATILFVAGLALINISVYLIFETDIGLLATGITVVIVGLIINHEQSQATGRR
jgi:amino acid transporter